MRSWPSLRAWPEAFLAGNVEPFMPSSSAASFSPATSAPSSRSMRAKCECRVAEHLERVPLALADHALQQLEGRGPVAPVDGVGEVPRRHPAVVAEERLDLGRRDLGAGAVGGAEQVDEAEQPARLVADPGDEPLAALGVDLQPGLGQVLLATHSPTLRPGLVSTCSPPARVTASRSAFGHLAGAPLEHEAGGRAAGRRGSRRAAATWSLRSRFSAIAAEHHPVLGEERRRLGGVDQREERIARRRSAAPTSTSSTTSERSSSPTSSSTSRRTASRSTTSSSPFSSVTGHRDSLTRRPLRAGGEDGGHHVGGAPGPADVVGPEDPAPERDAEGVGGVARLAAVVDVGADEVAEEPLVRRRQEQRPAEGGQPVVGPQQLERLRLGLAEVEAGVDHHPLARDAGRLGRLGAVAQEPAHRVDDRLVVDGLGIGDAGADADVGGDDRRTGRGRHRRGSRGRRSR